MNWTLGEPFYKHWLGLQPLPRAFWLFGFVGFFVSGMLVIFLVERPLQMLGYPGPGHALVYAEMWIYAVFAWVGIWRSANFYKGAKSWAITAKMAVVVFFLVMLQGFFKAGGLQPLLGLLTSN